MVKPEAVRPKAFEPKVAEPKVAEPVVLPTVEPQRGQTFLLLGVFVAAITLAVAGLRWLLW